MLSIVSNIESCFRRSRAVSRHHFQILSRRRWNYRCVRHYKPGKIFQISLIILRRSQNSFNRVAQWLQETYFDTSRSVSKVLVGNKSDLSTRRAVRYNTAKVNQTIESVYYQQLFLKTLLFTVVSEFRR